MKISRTCSIMTLALTACVSAPKIDYYTLSVDPSGNARPSSNLEVEAVLTTGALAGNRIYIQAAPTRVEYYATDRWAGSLGELVQQKLQSEFGPVVTGERTLKVSGTLLACGQLDMREGAAGHVKLAIVVRDPGRKRFEPPLLQKTYEATVGASVPTADAVVIAISRAVEQVAAEIAADTAGL